MPQFNQIDHVHVYARDRASAEVWYLRVLGLSRVPGLEHWATPEGPLFLSNADGSVSLALFQQHGQASQSTTIAFRATGAEFRKWEAHLKVCGVNAELVDHELSWSVYFCDPEGNPFEITSYEYDWLKASFSS